MYVFLVIFKKLQRSSNTQGFIITVQDKCDSKEPNSIGMILKDSVNRNAIVPESDSMVERPLAKKYGYHRMSQGRCN
jgi:hypothetical protein